MFQTTSNKIKEMKHKLEDKNILVIGAGGIGCELLKNLIMSGIKKITIVDMDKIENSNLNRQFLFSKDSINQFKSDTAKFSLENYRKDSTFLL